MVTKLTNNYKIGDTIVHPVYGKGQVEKLNLGLAIAEVRLLKPYTPPGRKVKRTYVSVNLLKVEQHAHDQKGAAK